MNLKYTILFLLFVHMAKGQNCPSTTLDIERESYKLPTILPPNNETASNLTPLEDTRVVGFIHGLAGSKDTWIRSRQFLNTTYQVHTPSIEYSQKSIDDAAHAVNSQMRSANNLVQLTVEEYEPDQSFLIAHSLGGVVSRQLERNYEEYSGAFDWQQQFGGLITFGTPHLGTRVVDNTGLAQQFAYEGCASLTEAYGEEFITNNLNIPLIGGMLKNKVRSLAFGGPNEQGLIDGFVCKNILARYLNAQLDRMLPTIGEELSPDNETMQNLSQETFDYPLVMAWGNENDPVSLRQIYSTTKDTNTDYELWGATDTAGEEEFIKGYEDFLDGLMAKAEQYTAIGNTILEILPNGGEEYFNLRDLFYEAYEWTELLDERYRVIFDIDDVEYVYNGDITACKCTLNGVSMLAECGSLPWFLCETISIPSYVVKTFKNDSDGVVKYSSAVGANGSVEMFTEQMIGSNHAQMKNDLNTQYIYRKYLDDASPFPLTEHFQLKGL